MYDTDPKEKSVVRASAYMDTVSGNVTSGYVAVCVGTSAEQNRGAAVGFTG